MAEGVKGEKEYVGMSSRVRETRADHHRIGRRRRCVCRHRALRSNQKNQRESTAKSVFREHLRLAFEHSDLAEPDYQKLQAQPDKYKKYSWFVAHLLWACEEILRYEEGKIWKENLQRNVNYHREYFINDSDFKEKDFHLYDPSVQELVQNAMARGRDGGVR